MFGSLGLECSVFEWGGGTMMAERAESIRKVEQDEPVPDHVFEDPTVQANIAEALAKVREGRAKPGKTGRELLNLPHEPRMDPRR